jgi:hypothetical protein
VTTYEQAVQVLGKPMSESADSLGDRAIVYMTTKSRVKAASFIPYVGVFFASATGTASMVVLSFGPNDRLINYQSSTTSTDCNAGVFGANCRGGMLVPPPTAAPAGAPLATQAAPPPP